MIIQTERLLLEPLAVKHYDTTLVYSIDPENTRMMCFLPCENGEEVMRYLQKCELQWQEERPDYLDAAIMLNGVHIGAVSVEFLENRTVGEFGWIIQKAYWGKGYTAEAAKAFMQYCNKRFQLRKFIAHADSENYASVRVMEKLGMRFVSSSGGRKNRGSDEERMETLYEIMIDDFADGK